MSLNRGIRKPPCGCYRCRYEAWRQRAVLRRRIGMRPPARPAKHPAMTLRIPCPCGTSRLSSRMEQKQEEGTMQSDPVNPSHYKGDYAMRVIEDFESTFKGHCHQVPTAGREERPRVAGLAEGRMVPATEDRKSSTHRHPVPITVILPIRNLPGKRKIESWNTSYSPS